MKQNWYTTRFYFIGLMVLIFSMVTTIESLGQCIKVKDPVSGQWTNTPQNYLRCPALADPIPGTVTINFQTPASNFTIDWGNGDIQTYLGPQASVSYTYPAASLFRFRISFPACLDSLKGTYVNQRNLTLGGVNVPGVGFIVPPAGVSNKRCVPEDLTIINGSPGMNGYTKWLIEWGDLEKDTIGNDFMRSYTHKYLPGTTGCSLQIRVTYLNGCGVNPINRPKASYGDYFFKDIDSAAITPASVIICAPTDVSINDISKLNCLDSIDRQLLWARTGGFAADLPFPGDGVFRPYTGINRLMKIPAASFFPIPSDSTYKLRMVIRNTCGDDSAEAIIRIVSPTKPKFAVINNNTCPGEQMNFSNLTSHRPYQSYRVDFGDGSIANLGFSATFSHTYSIGGTYKVKMWTNVNGYNGQTCGLVDSITVQVKTTISPIITVSPRLGCDTLTVRLKNSSKFTAGAVWRGWELGGGPLITAGSGVLPSLINFIQAQVKSTNLADSSAIIKFNVPGRYIIRLRAQTLGCPEISDFDTVDVYPSPVLRWRIPAKIVCLGKSVTVRDSSSVIPSVSTSRRGLGSTWNHISWKLEMGDGTVFNSASNITGNFSNVLGTDRLTSYTYLNPGSYWVKLTVRSPDRCPKVDSMRVTVLPAAVPNFKWKRDICNPGLITFMNQTNGTSQRYEWIIRRGTVLIAKEVRLAKDTFSYPLSYFPPSDSTFYYVTLRAVSGTSPDTCVASTAPFLIKIPASKQAAFSASALDGCTPVNDVVFVNQSIGIPTDGSHTYTWRFGNGNTFVGENPPLQNYVNNGVNFKRDTVKLAITSNGSCVYRAHKVITIYPVPNPAIVAPAEVCHNTLVSFSATGNGIGTYNWSFLQVDGTNSTQPNPGKTFNNTGTLPIQYIIKLTATTVAGCADTVLKAIIVNPRPSASFTATPEAACGASPVIFDASSSVAAATYSWNFSDGTSGITDTTVSVISRFFPQNTTTIDRTYAITLTTKSDKGCPGPVATKSVRIRPTVIASFVPDKKIGCSPLTVNFLNFSSQTDDSYTWYVNELGAPGLGVPSIPNQPNRGFIYTFYNNSFTTVTRFVVTLMVKDDNGSPICESSKSDTITVNPKPLASFLRDQVSPTTLCSPTSMRIKVTDSQGATSYKWTFSDNSPVINATDSLPFFKTLVNNGVTILPYTIKLLVRNSFGCVDSVNQTINLRPKVTAAASVDNIKGCSPLVSNFTNLSSASAISFTWYRNSLPVFFNKDIPAQTFLNNSATDTAFYNVFVVARGQGDVCIDTSSSLFIKVLPKPTVVSSANPSNGCSPLQVKLNASGTVGGVSYAWFVKKSTDPTYTLIQTTSSPAEFNHTLFNSGLVAGNFQIKLVVTGLGSCPDSSISTVTVFPDVVPTFSSSVVSGCSPIRPVFNITSTGPLGTSYVWKVDSIPQFDPTPSSFEYTFAGQSDTTNTQYLITLQAISSSGCTRDVSQIISVYPKPSLDLSIISSPFVSCSPVKASFIPVVKGPIATLNWVFDNTDSLLTTKDTTVYRTYINAGILPATHIVKLKLTTVNGCKAEISKSLSINPGVIAGFSQSATEGCSPLKVNFVNDGSSAGANVFEWYVDGILVGNSAIGINQSFTNGSFSSTKVYTIQLVAKNSSSNTCLDTATRFVTVYRKPEVSASAFPLDGCSPLKTSLTASNSQGGVLYQWYKKLNNQSVYQLDTTLSNGQAFNRILTNTTGSVLTYNLKVVVSGGDGCKDSTVVSVNVSPQIKAGFTVSPDTAGCAPLAAVFGNGTTSAAANSYQWIVDGVGVSNSPAFLTYSFDNTSNTDVKVYKVQLVASNLTFGCPDTAVKNMTIWPKPLVNQLITMDPLTGCSPVNVGFQPINFAGVSTFTWYLPDTLTTTLDTVVTRSFVNNTILPQTKWITLTGRNVYGCESKKISSFQINPRVEASFTASRDSVCSPAEITFNNTSSPGVNVAEWYINGVFKGNSLSGVTDLFENNDSIPKQFTIRLVVRNSITTACEDTASKVITIFPKPLAGNIFASIENGCSPLQVNFTGSAQFAKRFIWDFGDGFTIDTNSQQARHTFYNLNSTINAQFTVWQVAINTYGCADSTFSIVNVRPNVTAGIIASDSMGCSPLLVSFSGAASVNANSYAWNFGLGNTATGSSVSRIFTNTSDTSRTFRIRLIADRSGIGCPDTAFVSVKVNPKPVSDFDASPNAGCQPLKVTFTNNSTLAVSGYWILTGGPSIDTIQGLAGFDSTFKNNTSINQIVKAELFVTSGQGCVAQSSKLISVSPFVNADFVQSADSGCTPLAINFTNLSAPGSSASWFVDGVLVNYAANQFNYSFVNSTQNVKIFEVKLLVASVLNVGCMDTAVRFVTVFPKPVASVLGAVPDNGCSPVNISLFSYALGATRFQYDFNDGSVLDTNIATVSHTFINNASLTTRNFNVKLLVSNSFGCFDNSSKLVSIKPTVKAVINSPDTLGCTPYSVGLSGLNSVNSNLYKWDFGDGSSSSLATPVKVYNNLSDTIQNYTVQLVTDRSGINCPDTTIFKLRVYPKPVTDFAPNPTLGCNPLPVSITNLTTGYTSATYTFSGNGQTVNIPATVANFDTVFVNDQSNLNLNVEISLTATNQLGCSDTKTRIVTIYPDIKAAFNQSAFTGCAPLKVRMVNQSLSGNLVKWYINGQLVSSTLSTLNYTFENMGFSNKIYKVQLVASSALSPQCTDTANSIVMVYPKPDAGVLTAIPEIACSPATIGFVGSAVGANQFNWNFGDGAEFDTSSQSLEHVFFNNNSFNNRIFRVRLIAGNQNGCTDTTFKNITVRPLVGAIILSNDSIGCTPFSASFSGSQSRNANQYTWNFGGLGSSTLVNPNFVFVNTSDSTECHTVRLITQKIGIECSDTAYFKVCVYPRPVPEFSVVPTSGCQPLAVSFINQSQLADSSVWVLNSNGFQTETTSLNFDTIIENVSSQIKNVRVKLLTYTSKGCVNSIEKQFNVSPFVQAGFVQNLDSNCSPLRVRFTNQSAAGNLVNWYVDGQLVSTLLNNFSYVFVNNGFVNKTYQVKLISRSALDPNCTDTAVSTVTVFPKPNAGVINALPEIACSPAKIDFVGTAVGATRFNWNFGDATELDTTAQEVSHVFSNTNSLNNRNFSVRMIVSNVQGCSDSSYKNVTIRPLVRAVILSNDSLGCTPFNAEFVGSQSTNASQYIWNFGILGSSTLMNPVFTFVNNTDSTECHTVRLITQKAGVECADTAFFKVCVNPRPVTEFNINPVSGCQPLSVNLTNQSQLADSSVWVFNANGFQSTVSALNYDTIVGNNTAQIKTVRVTLFTYTNNGCVHSKVRQFTVAPFVKADFSQSLDSGCSPLPVSFVNISSSGCSASWFVDGTQISSSNGSFNFTFINNNTQIRVVEVKLIVRNNLVSSCTDTIIKKIYVFPKPEIGVISASPESGCSPLLSQLSASPNMGSRFIWDFKDGTTLDSNLLTVAHEFVSFNPSANLPFNVRLIAITDKGCTDTASKTLMVSPFTIARIGIADSVGCSPISMQLAGALSQNANRFTWDFGDGSNSSLVANPVKTFVNNTQADAVYKVRLIASRSGFSCPDTAYKTIRVFANPKASFSANIYSGCGPLPVQFVNNAELADSMMWVISSLSGVDTLFTTAANWDTTFSNPFSQQMNVRVEQHVWTNNGCYNSLVRNIIVNPDVKPLFTVSSNGCSPLNVRFTNLSTNPGGAYQWTFGDGTPASTAFSPSHLFRNVGGKESTYTVTLLAISNPAFAPACNQTFTFPVKVFAKPAPDFTISPQILILPQTIANFTNLTNNRENWKYKWYFGDNKQDTANGLVVIHDYNSIVSELSNSSVTVKMIAYSPNGCKDSVSKTLEIRPIKPVVNFEPDTSGCAPLLVSFKNKSKYGNQYLWTFGDGTASTEQNPSKRYEQPGEYSVSLKVTGPGGDETLKRNNIIQVFENPDAGFTTVPKAPRALKIPEEKMNCFVRYPQPGWTYEWNFGDGNISREKDPVHAYKEPGSFNVTLTVTTAEGCVDRDTLTNGAIVEKGNIVIVPNAFTPRKEGSTGGYLDKEDGTNDIFYPLTEGVTEIRMQIFNRWGQFLYESSTLNRGWDGTFEGNNCKADVYVYKVWCRFVDGRTETRVGDLTLLR